MPTYRGFGPRKGRLPLVKGAVDFNDAEGLAVNLALIGDAELPPVEACAAQPFVGVTTTGEPEPGLYRLVDEGFDPAGAALAAESYLALLPGPRREKAVSPVESPDWQMWTNAFLTFPEHGLLMEDMSERERLAALDVIRATLSPEGFTQIREAMRLNGELGHFVDMYLDTLTEWCYWFTVFGTPGEREPWGWQIQGHHVDLNCLVLGRQVVLTPAFLGAEFHGERIFSSHRRSALTLLESLAPAQRERAVLYGSMSPDELPHHLAGKVDGRHRAGAGRDNLVLPYEGISGADLTQDQQHLMMDVLDNYLAPLPPGHAAARRRQVEDHLQSSWFACIGTTDPEQPFYYRIHSPVILIEYDNHPGVFLDNDNPEPFHVHTIVRTPNGGDYGKSLLADHYARFHH
ncbi:DUF3500 domain-containing protein [Streptomyces bobili]|uniref:DUF3500 domain-containing protein n=1 Tax=Streptomyces bobili TaxID=67280 RepID=UPI0036566048